MPNTGPAVGDIFHPGGRLRLGLFSDDAIAALREAVGQAHSSGRSCLRTSHLFLALMQCRDARMQNWVRRSVGRDPDLLGNFRDEMQLNAGSIGPVFLNREFLSDNMIRVLRESTERSVEAGRHRVEPFDLLVSLFTTNSMVAKFFEREGVSAAKLAELAVRAELGDSPSGPSAHSA